MFTPDNSRVFVTGADGLLGSHVVRQLLARQYRVRALIQPGVAAKSLAGLPIHQVEGDLLDAARVEAAMTGCAYVIHVAGITDQWPDRHPKFHAVNVQGTDHVIAAALRHQVTRLVHVSSSNAFGAGDARRPGTERSPWKGYLYGHDYFDTKFISQQRVLQAVAEHHLPAIVVNPTFMLGPIDRRPSSGKLLVTAWNQTLKFCSAGGKNFVHVRDVATGIVNALSMGRLGACYLLGHENLTFAQLFQKIEQVTGKRQPRRVAPPWILKLTGALMGSLARLTRRPPVLSYKMAWMASEIMYYSAQKAVQELNLPQTPIETAIREAYAWFADNGYLLHPEKLPQDEKVTLSA